MDTPSPSTQASRPWPAGALFERALVVGNPIAGRGKGANVAREIAEGLRQMGVPTELFLTSARGDARAHLRSAGTEPDLVVSVGGDGTLSEVFSGLMNPETPVGVVPMGTANCLGHELGLPRDVHRALEVFRAHNVRAIDVARVNDHISFLVTGVGLDGISVREVERRRTGPISKVHYARAVLGSLVAYRPPRLSVVLDGKPLPDTFGQVLISNTRNYGGFLNLAPDTRLDDGLYEVYLFPTGTRRELLVAAVRGVVGHLPAGPVTMRRARLVEVTSDEPVPFQVDGDYRGETPVQLEVSSTQYHLVVP